MLLNFEMKCYRFFFSKYRLVFLALTVISFLPALKLKAQDTTVIVSNLADTAIKEKHSAKKASIYSMVLPGLGQAYNHKYWKIPIIYAGFGVLGYNIHVNNKEMQLFTEAYRYKIRKDTTLQGNKYFDK